MSDKDPKVRESLLSDAQARGQHAEFLKASAGEILKDMRTSVLETFAQTAIDDREMHHWLRIYLACMNDFQERLNKAIGVGAAATIELADMRKLMN